MMWDEWDSEEEDDADRQHHAPPDQSDSHDHCFDSSSIVSKPKDYYKILEVDCDASEDTIRSNYIRLALKWHPDKHKDQDCTTAIFQDINEAYQVLSDPDKRREFDNEGMLHFYDHSIKDYLNRYKGLILTCNGLGMKHSVW